jgi:hypothetical protein
VRRCNLEIYFQTHGVAIGCIIKMGTLEFVARRPGSDVARPDLCKQHSRAHQIVNPLVDPPLSPDPFSLRRRAAKPRHKTGGR